MAHNLNVIVTGYICPPEVDVYADLPEFEPEFSVDVKYYPGRRASYIDPADEASIDVQDIHYLDKTPMTQAEKDYWLEELKDQIEDKAFDEAADY